MAGDWQEFLLVHYRDTVGDTKADAIDRKIAVDAVLDDLTEAISDGTVDAPPWEAAARRELEHIDRRDAQAADHLLAQISLWGAESLPMEDDPAGALVVTLGGGKRKTWRYLNEDDLLALDDLRYRNARSVANAYDEFRRHVTRPWRPVLRRHATVGDALRAGDFPTVEDPT